eukprot:6177376-Pleurochrysis_carterae.AAC.1
MLELSCWRPNRTESVVVPSWQSWELLSSSAYALKECNLYDNGTPMPASFHVSFDNNVFIIEAFCAFCLLMRMCSVFLWALHNPVQNKMPIRTR